MKSKLFGNLDQGLLFVISAPAGTGKSTLVDMLIKEFPGDITQSISCTTRSPRLGEVAGKDYKFLSLDDFTKKVKADEFLEYAVVFGNYYGTLKKDIVELRKQKKHTVLVIDTQGAMQIKGKIPAVFIFIQPPSMEELKSRLFKRQSESEEKILERLEFAKKEITFAKEYDYNVVNEELELTYQIIRSIIIAEVYKRSKRR